MEPKAKILIATDFSDGAGAALVEGRALAERLDADIEVLYVNDPVAPAVSRVAALLSASAVDPRKVSTRTGTAWVEIVRRALEIRPLAVVVGSHGRGGFQPLTPGTTTMRLLVRCPVPVLVVPPARESETAAASEEAAAQTS